MCLAVPGKVVKRDDDLKATVDMMGIERPVSLRLVPTAQVGDYILVHAGFGIQIADEFTDAFDELAGQLGIAKYRKVDTGASRLRRRH